MSIGCLLTMPGAHGLFHKAILQSCFGGIPAVPSGKAGETAGQLIDILGIKPGDTGALRKSTAEQLLSADEELRRKMSLPGQAPVVTLYKPVLDGSIISEVPVKAIKNGAAGKIPVLIGSTLEEFRLFGNLSPAFLKMSESEMVTGCQSFLPAESVPGIIETYRSARVKRGDDATPAGIFAAITNGLFVQITGNSFHRSPEAICPSL
jgi:carboxylesterase type B